MNYILFKHNKVLLLLLALLLVASIFFYRNHTKAIFTPEPSRSFDTQNTTSSNDLRAAPVSSTHKPESATGSNAAEEPRTVMGNAAEAEIVNKWLIAHGDPSLTPVEYKNYSIETLQKLSDGGDIYAMQLLADKVKYLTRNGKTEAKALLMRAAAYGSTNALNMQSINEMHLILDADNEAEKKSLVIDNLVYIKAAALRGDLTHYYRDMTFPSTKRFGVALTETDVKEINDRAAALIDELQKQRLALGLGEFDNSQSPEVKRYFENINPSDLGHKPYF